MVETIVVIKSWYYKLSCHNLWWSEFLSQLISGHYGNMWLHKLDIAGVFVPSTGAYAAKQWRESSEKVAQKATTKGLRKIKIIQVLV